MKSSESTLAEELVRLIEVNRKAINGLTYGTLVFKMHQGRIVEITASESLKVTASAHLSVLSLSSEEVE